MENKRRNNGGVIILMGCIILGIYFPKINFEKIRTVDIGLLASLAVFISCGVYILIKSKNNRQRQ
ncbi:hypothetical protein HYN49_08165 [Flavobacterium pallidum]|uniref:DUF3098 domain-containing protein n=1 Tax=Flavobacterium pallidum TaxID=2172098 RepID=A0A2S1SHI4_9FLAO|nr:hypothetical protein HYN49_08165 [Flavobacterium pallidum]